MTERKTGSFEDFKAYTLAVVRGERGVDPNEPKVWVERAAEYNRDPTGRDDKRAQENEPS